MFEFGKVRFRATEKDDLRFIHEWENDAEVMTFSRNVPMNFANIAQIEKMYDEWNKNDKELRFIVELLETNEPIGVARIEQWDWGGVRTADIGTYIGKKTLWEKGIGKQITLALLEMCFFEMNMDRCEASSVEYNQRAHRVLEKCGFRKAGVMRQSAFVKGRKWDRYKFDILKEEYLNVRETLLAETLGENAKEYLETQLIGPKNA